MYRSCIQAATFLGVIAASTSVLGMPNVESPKTEEASVSSVHLAQTLYTWRVIRTFRQNARSAAQGGFREEADITEISCNGRNYFIYRYFRPTPPNYRAISPPNWGTPLGGGDKYSFGEAAQAACRS